MGYGTTDEESERAHKTGRIAILSILIFCLGGFVFAYKVDACKSTPANCKDEFFEIDTSSRYNNNKSCSPGAVVEVVNSPPAPKPGIICHCPGNGPTASPSPSH